MAFLKIPNVCIRGIAACVPPRVEEVKNIPFYTPEEAEKIIAATGVERMHVADDTITGSDLSLKAAKRLLDEMGWDRNSIDAICYVTQTPDYIKHPTAFVMHDKLGLSENCMVLDMYYGCPGWVVGLSTLSSLMSHGTIKRGLLFASDTITRIESPMNQEARPIMGDCGAVTALEFGEGKFSPLLFETGARGKDGMNLARLKGAMRNPHTPESFKKEYDFLHGIKDDIKQGDMDGMSVFSFGISVPPKSIKMLCAEYNIDINNIDKLVLHQGNKFMINKIAKKVKIDSSKVPSCLKDFGNTTSASIPLTIVSQCGKEYSSKKLKTICCGFGTGLSWASAYFETNNIVCPEVIIY